MFRFTLTSVLCSVLVLVTLAPRVVAGPNSSATLALHAVVTGGFASCAIADPCNPGPPRTNVPPGEPVVVYLVLRNHDNVAALQTAFDWENWVFNMGLWNCQANQTFARMPKVPGGGTDGTLTTSFDAITGSSSAVIGRMLFAAANGCVRQVPSSFALGTHVVSGTGEIDAITADERLGAVCTSSPGVDACQPFANAVPTCDAGGPYGADVGQPIILDGSGSTDPDGIIDLFVWEFGDGASGQGSFPQVVHTYASSGSYTVTLCVRDDNGAETCCSTEAVVGGANAVADEPEPSRLPSRLLLRSIRPNPFNPSTRIEFDLDREQHVRLRIYDASGRAVRTLVDADLGPGSHTVSWNGRDQHGRRVESGVYVCRLQAGDRTASRKLVLSK